MTKYVVKVEIEIYNPTGTITVEAENAEAAKRFVENFLGDLEEEEKIIWDDISDDEWIEVIGVDEVK